MVIGYGAAKAGNSRKDKLETKLMADVTGHVRVRFAPSPTGLLHIGNARTALFNYLFAKKHKGILVLRIEDTDMERSQEHYIEHIVRDLKWIGIHWDEGPDIGGDFGPYQQSLRSEIYEQYRKRLLESGHAYPCYCSEEELETRRKQALQQGKVLRYDNRCRQLTKQEITSYERAGRQPTTRFKLPRKVITVDDLVRGPVDFDTDLMGDFVIFRSDGSPSFHLAVVVDDAEMKITHVVRGEDHLSNTPRHIALYEALGLNLPRFAHMSMTLGPDGARLSKRHGAASISAYRELGYLPEALTNYLALLGWSPGDDREIMTMVEMTELFSIDRLTKSAAIFGQDKLDWMSGVYIRESSLEKITRLMIPYLQKSGQLKKDVDDKVFAWLLKIAGVVRGYLKCLSEVPAYADIYMDKELNMQGEALDRLRENEMSGDILKNFSEKLIRTTEFNNDFFSQAVKEIQKEKNIKAKDVYVPLRMALTGKVKGPELHIAVPILGRDTCLLRMKKAIDCLEGKNHRNDS